MSRSDNGFPCWRRRIMRFMSVLIACVAPTVDVGLVDHLDHLLDLGL